VHVYPPAFFDDHDYQIDSRLCFVVMPFTASWSDQIYGEIKTTVAECGYRCRRADEFYGRVVLGDIWRGLSEAAFIVADLSDQNPNAFYELGLAHLLGKELIPLLQNGQSVPFDQAPFRILRYDTSAGGRRLLHAQLTQWITNLDFASVPELMLRRGAVSEFNLWRQAHALRPLRREDFSEATLAGVALRDANLAEANFTRANLRGADLVNTNLIRCSLGGADLSDANLSHANVSEANLTGASMRRADLRGVIMLRAELSGAELVDANVDGLTIDFASYQKFEPVFAHCRAREALIVER
jgi:hypothetical protein